MFNKLTTFGKICVIAVILAIVGTGLYFAGGKMNLSLPGGSSSGDYDATIMVILIVASNLLYGVTEV